MSGGADSLSLLRTLVDKLPGMIAYWDSEQRCRFANRAYERWFGVSPESLIGKHISELLGPLYPLNRPYIEGALRGEPQQFEREIPDPAGGPARHSLASYIPDVVDGVTRGFFVMVTDVSAVKRAERALRESEERFRLIVDEAPIGMALVALDGRFVRVNRALCELVGYSAEELTGLTFRDITHPDDLEADLALAGRLARGEIPRYQLEKRYVRKDGSIVDIQLTGASLRAPGGAPLYFIAQIEDVTERKRLADRLRQAEARSSGILSISADAIISVDEEQRISMFNRGAEVIFGYSSAEALGAPLDLLLPEALREAHRSHVDAFGRGGEVARRMGERRAPIFGRRKSGEEFPADATISKLVVGGKRLLTVVLRDITEQTQAREALHQSEERLELALEGAELASWDWNIETGEVIFNARWAELRGCSPGELRPHVDTWLSGVHPDDLPQVQRALADHFEGRSPVYETEHRVRRRSGRWLWILDRGKVFARDANGRPSRMAGTELDITQRRRAQDEQRFLAEVGTILAGSLDLEATLAAIARLAVKKLTDCVIVDLVDERQVLQHPLVAHADPCKAALCERLERLHVDRARGHLAASVFETRKPKLMGEIGPEYLEGIAQSEEHLRLLRELDPRSLMAVPLLGRERLLGALLFISPTPNRYDSQDLDFAGELANRAALAIENAQLYEKARRATQLRDEVLGIVAHDLRSPLSSILLQANRLRRRGGEPDRRSQRPAELLEAAASRMNRLIQDLLDVTRIEAGRLSVEPGRLEARRLLEDSVELLRPSAAAASLELQLGVADELADVWGDRDRLLQVLENLVGNAVKFTPPGGAITLGAARRESDVLFWVADTGPGIPAEDVPRVFDRFWQAHRATRHGAGLGLPIVKGLVEAHGGRVWVESLPGRGTTFFFTVPLAVGARLGSEATLAH